MTLLFSLTALVYLLYAALPFLHLNSLVHYVLGGVFAVLGSILWVTISRGIDQSQIPLYGLYFDAIITASFFITPVVISGLNFTLQQILGMILIILGILVSKI